MTHFLALDSYFFLNLTVIVWTAFQHARSIRYPTYMIITRSSHSIRGCTKAIGKQCKSCTLKLNHLILIEMSLHKHHQHPFGTSTTFATSELFIERPSGFTAQFMTFSNYQHHTTIKFLVAIVPIVEICYVNTAWGGNQVSDNWKLRLFAYYSQTPQDRFQPESIELTRQIESNWVLLFQLFSEFAAFSVKWKWHTL